MTLEQAQQLTVTELQDAATRSEVVALVSQLVEGLEHSDARRLLRSLQRTIREAKSATAPLLEQYRDVLVALQTLAFRDLNDAEQVGLFREQFSRAAVLDVNIPELVADALGQLEPADWPLWKTKLLNALLDNTEALTTTPLHLAPGQGAEESFTIGHFLRYYIEQIEGQPVVLGRAEFFSHDQNYQELDERGQQIVAVLLKVYDYLIRPNDGILSVNEPTYFDFEDGTTAGVWRGSVVSVEETKGQRPAAPAAAALRPAPPPLPSRPTPPVQTPRVVPPPPPRPAPIPEPQPLAPVSQPAPVQEQKPAVPVAPPTPAKAVITPPPAPVQPASPSPADILKKYQGSGDHDARLKERTAILQSTTGSDVASLSNSLATLLQSNRPDADDVAAHLVLLASQGVLGHLLRDNQRYYRLVSTALEQSQQPERARDFALYPDSPQYVQFFLELILQGKLHWPESDAARLGVRLANLMKRAGQTQYATIAYFDEGRGEFHWRR